MAYLLITIAAPVYLKKLGEVKAKHWAGCGASLALLIVPAIGSVYPVPAAPVKYFPYAFLLYLAVGLVWILMTYGRKPNASAFAREDLIGPTAASSASRWPARPRRHWRTM